MDKCGYPVDPAWERIPDVGLEKWPNYDTDVAAWAEQQADALRGHRVEQLDWEHRADEILDIARAERRELAHRVSAPLCSLARQSLGEQTPADVRLVREQRKLVWMQFSDCPSIERWLAEPSRLARCWSDALVSLATAGLPIEDLPDECPFDRNAILLGE